MKYIFLICTALISFSALGQVKIDRSKAPTPASAPEVNIGTPASFTTKNGIRVFVVENHETPKINVSLVLKREPVMENDKVGYISMAGSMMRRGTDTKSKAELDEEIDFLGGSIHTGSTSANAFSLTKNFDKIFEIFSDIILHPAFKESELEKVKKRTLSALESNEDDPDAILRNVVHVANYGKSHPYGEIETPETVKNITTKDVKDYYNTYWKPNIAYMAFVGDINVEEAKNLVNKYLKNWAKGDVPQPTYPQPKAPKGNQIYVVDRPSGVQTNINITDPIDLKPGADDFFRATLMNQILGGGSAGWLFQDLREKYGFTYGAYSSLNSDPLVGSFSASAAVRTAVTDSSLMRFMVQLNKIRDKKVSRDKLDSVKNIRSGNFALSLESPSRIAQFALNIARYNLPKDYYKNYLKNVAAVTIEEIQDAAEKYILPENTNIVLVGNSKEFASALSQYGEVHYVDNYGNPKEAPSQKSIPAGVTAKSVLTDYLDAIGLSDPASFQKIKDISIKGETEVRGTKIEINIKYILQDKYMMAMTLPSNGNTLSKITVNGQQIKVKQMGRDVPLDEDRKSSIQSLVHPFPEYYYLNSEDQLELVGIEKVNNKEAYHLVVTSPEGQVTDYFYDTENGLKLREKTSEETPQGSRVNMTNYSNYKKVDGISFPFTLKSQTGPIQMEISIDSIKINSDLTEEDLK